MRSRSITCLIRPQQTHTTVNRKDHMKLTNRLNTYPSMAAAAGALNVNIGTLRTLKKAGAAGFDAGNRVDLFKLLAWILQRRDDGAPTVSLESARTRLALAQAAKLEAEAQLAGGKLLPVGWIVNRVSEAFESPVFTQWLFERTPKLAWMVRHPVADAEGQRFLAEDAKSIARSLEQLKEALLRDLENGPDEAINGTIYGDMITLLRETADRCSPETKAEFLKVMNEVDESIQANRKEVQE